MKQLLTIVFLLVFVFIAGAQNLQLQWAKALTGTGKVSVLNIVSDNLDNVYISGSFEGVADFDPGNGVANLTTGIGFSNRQYFLAKYNAQGNYIFAHQFKVQYIKSLVLDNAANIYIGGAFDTIVDFNPGPGVNQLAYLGGLSDGFIAKYNSNGDYVNAFSISGTDAENVDRLGIDNDGNLYAGGPFKGSIDVDPNGTATLTASSNNEDMFIAKYTPSGTLINHFKLTSAHDLRSLIIDHNNNLWLAGIFGGPLDLDPGPNNTGNSNINGQDGFYAKYDSNGNYIKGYTFDGYTSYIQVDNNDNLYILGITLDSMDIAPGAPVYMIYSLGNVNDYYIAKMDANDNVVYANVFKGTAAYFGGGLQLGAQNSFFIFGNMSDSLDLSASTPAGMLVSHGSTDAYIAQFDLDGNHIFSANYGDTLGDNGASFNVDTHGNVWLAGHINGTVDFDFGPATTNLVATPNQGGFIARYTDPLFTSFSEINPGLPIKVYGAENKIFVDFSALSNTNAQVQVLNLTGQTVIDIKHNQNNKLQIVLPHIAGGIYLVRVVNEGKTATKKIFIE